MEKEKILLAFYRSKIAALAERCDDVDLLDLIYKLLKNETNDKSGETLKRRKTL